MDVDELLHDRHPTVCVRGIALGYVNAFTSHVNVGFFLGSTLHDPDHLLEGTGKFMRHVKVRPSEQGRDDEPHRNPAPLCELTRSTPTAPAMQAKRSSGPNTGALVQASITSSGVGERAA